MKYKTGIVIMAAVFLLQPFFGALIPVLGRPDVIMCIMAASAASMTEKDAFPLVTAGFVFELLRDMVFSQYIGSGLMSVAGVLLVVLAMRKLITVDAPAGNVLMSITAAVSKPFFSWLLAMATGEKCGLVYVFRSSFVSIIADAVLIAAICYFTGRNRSSSDNFGNGFFV